MINFVSLKHRKARAPVVNVNDKLQNLEIHSNAAEKIKLHFHVLRDTLVKYKHYLNLQQTDQTLINWICSNCWTLSDLKLSKQMLRLNANNFVNKQSIIEMK